MGNLNMITGQIERELSPREQAELVDGLVKKGRIEFRTIIRAVELWNGLLEPWNIKQLEVSGGKDREGPIQNIYPGGGACACTDDIKRGGGPGQGGGDKRESA